MVENENEARSFNGSYSLLKRKKKSPVVKFFNKSFGKTPNDIIKGDAGLLIKIILFVII